MLSSTAQAVAPEVANHPVGSVSPEVLLPTGHELTLNSTYPHANLGKLVRNLVASKAHREGVKQAEALRTALLRVPTLRPAPLGTEQWLRSFVLVREWGTGRLTSAGVMHATLRLEEQAGAATGTLALAATLRFVSSHLATQARELGAAQPAAQLFAAEVLRGLSFDCKDVFTARRRPVSVSLAVEFGVGCPDYLKSALGRGLVEESWRIASWRAAPLSL